MSSKVLDWLKPQRSEAVARLRSNGLGLLVVFIVTSLLPLPSPLAALSLLWTSKYLRYDTTAGSGWWLLCVLGASCDDFRFVCGANRSLLLRFV